MDLACRRARGVVRRSRWKYSQPDAVHLIAADSIDRKTAVDCPNRPWNPQGIEMPPMNEQEILRFPPSAVAARSVNDIRIPDEAIRADAGGLRCLDECAMDMVGLWLIGIDGY